MVSVVVAVWLCVLLVLSSLIVLFILFMFTWFVILDFRVWFKFVELSFGLRWWFVVVSVIGLCGFLCYLRSGDARWYLNCFM